MFEYIKSRRASNAELTWHDLAQEVNTKYGTQHTKESLRSWYRRQNVEPLALPKPFEDVMSLPHAVTLVVSDFHCPYHDATILALAKQAAMHHGVTQVVVAGDLFDFNVISSHPKNDPTSKLQSDLHIGGNVLLSLADIAPVYVTNGNHDERLAKKLDTNLPLSSVVHMALAGKTPLNAITVTEYDYLYIGAQFIAGHLSSYSREPGKIAADLAQKYQRHTLVGHDHLTGVELSKDETHFGISIGGMMQKDRFWYKERRLTVLPDFQNGFAIINYDGSITLYGDRGKKKTYAIYD